MGHIMKNKPIQRYPGIPPFTEEYKDVFFGRKADRDRLYNLLITENAVLLQSKSGMGKSSLINAGLIPLLKQRDDVVIHSFRFKNYIEKISESPLENMVNTINEDNKTTSFLDILIPAENSLWYHFKTKQIIAGGNLTFYLIFDQFEELFTYPPELVFAFKKQMADLLYSLLPKNFQIVLNRKKENKDKDLPDDKEITQLYENLDIHVLFAIRADKVSEIDQLSDYLPTILRTRFELGPLKYDQIKEAIIEPARQDGNFASPKFGFQNEVVAKIIKYLTKEGLVSAENTQLQLICQKLEQRVPVDSEPGKFIIKKEHLPEFKDLILEFYRDVINMIDVDERAKTEKFIEDNLIKKDQRIPLDRLVCLDYISEKALDILLTNHLLRSERNSAGGVSFELAHDTLVPPIKGIAETRRQKEKEEHEKAIQQEELRIEKEKAEKIRIEHEKEAKQQAELLALEKARVAEAERATLLAEENFRNQVVAARKQKRLKNISLVVAVITGVLVIIAIYSMNKASTNLAKYLESDANRLFKEENFKDARLKYENLIDKNLLKRTEMPDSVMARMKLCIYYDSIKPLFYPMFLSADSLTNVNTIGDLITAGSLITQLEKLNFIPAKNRLGPLKTEYNEKVQAMVTDQKAKVDMYMAFPDKLYYPEARDMLIRLHRLDSTDVSIINLLERVQN